MGFCDDTDDTAATRGQYLALSKGTAGRRLVISIVSALQLICLLAYAKIT